MNSGVNLVGPVVSSLLTETDQRFMQRALRLARRGHGAVEPNPMVGCVIVRGGRVVGEGHHQRYGGPHAEVEALRRAGSAARGATFYVTLEPCSHHGKTPPCADAIIEAGASRVIAAMRDPFPKVSGKGFAKLRKAGITVDTGLCEAEAADLNAPFLTRVSLGRPFVIAKWAQSLDGKIATRSGHSKWITGDAARRLGHQLRARVDAIMVGIETVLADDPTLTAREIKSRRIATRVIVDSRLRIPLRCNLVQTAKQAPVLVMTTRAALKSESAKANRLRKCAIEIAGCRSGNGRVDLKDALARLHERSVTNLLVEGGGGLIGGLLDAGLVDEVCVFTAPILIGGAQATSGYAGTGVSRVDDAIRLTTFQSRWIGTDLLVRGRLRDARSLLVSGK